jgi:hypothetical protein
MDQPGITGLLGWSLAVSAERQPLEEVAKPLSGVD